MKPVVSIGNQNFMSIREHHCFYVDKTKFIKEWWEGHDIVTLITRPRRFGKTLNINMVETFFSNQYADRGDLFEGLSIWEEKTYQELQGTYPVISLSFAAIKSSTYAMAKEGIAQLIIDLYTKFHFLSLSANLDSKEKEYLEYVNPNMSDIIIQMSLQRLALCLSQHYRKKVIILLDEYDTPLQEAYVYGYWEEMAAFIRSLFNFTFKTNPYLERGMMTGITRVSKESIFSDLNNLEVITITSHKYKTMFGFTQEEVDKSLKLFGLSNMAEKVKFWYDGFQFGDQTNIYNPWSITKYLDSGKLKTYWANTSSNSLAGKLIREGTSEIKITMEDLLAGKQICTFLDEEIVFNRLDKSDTAIWSLLLASGYLKAELVSEDEESEDEMYQVSITNYEVWKMFQKMIEDWFKNPFTHYNDFIKALLIDDIKYMNRFMNQVTEETFSFFDTGRQASKLEPERFYHGFVLGLIADSRIDYRITSNRESGFGRYDVIMEPRNASDYAYVFEFKVHDPETEKTLQDTVKEALAQIEEKNYDADLLARGILKERIRHYGFAFEGKKVLIGK